VHGFELVVAELDEGCKPKALNHGDLNALTTASNLPGRGYRLSSNAISRWPRIREEAEFIGSARESGCSGEAWVTRAYLKVWPEYTVHPERCDLRFFMA